MSSQLPRFSPDSKKKKPALPSLLSNIRNAQAAIGRAAADDVHDRETRPLVSAGGGGGARTAVPSSHPQLSRSAPSASLSSTLHNFSQRFGSQWRKRSQRKKGGGVTVVPQTFFLAVGCFFFAFPLFFVLYILARHAVFGDEGESSGSQVHVHEVPASLGTSFESGKELLEMNTVDIDNPEDEVKMYSSLNQTSVHEDASITIDTHVMEGGDIPAVEIESATGDLHGETGQTVGDNSDQNMREKVSMTETNNVDGNINEDSTKDLHHGSMQNVTSEGGKNILVRK